MRIPREVQRLVAAMVVMTVGVVWALVARYGSAGVGSWWVLAVLAFWVLLSCLRPLVLYQEESSSAHHLDEGFFLVSALVLPPLGVLVAFTVPVAVAQLVHRRSPSKLAFNLAQAALSVGAGEAVVRGLAPPGSRLSVATVAAGLLGAVVYFLINDVSLAAVLAAMDRQPFKQVVAAGLSVRLMLFACALSLGVVSALAVSTYPGAALVIIVPFWVCRQLLMASFAARHDHARLWGLFEATLEVQRTMGEEAVSLALCRAASRLLRCSEAEISTEPPGEGVMAAKLSVRGAERWLAVSGRSRTEPFDDADQGMLGTLAAAGAAALENASLYEERRKQQERIAAITASLGEGVCAFDSSGQVSFLNPAARELLGLPTLTELGAALAPELARLAEPALRVISSGNAITAERDVFVASGGKSIPVEYSCSAIRSEGGVEGAVVTFRDISERLAFEEQLAFHAFRDSLTGLPNRRVFLDRLQHALTRAGRSGEIHAVLFADIDRFKVANDSLGHQAGDHLLVTIADRLRGLARAEDTLARFGGDEFTLLVEGVADARAALEVAERMVEMVHRPVRLEGGRTIVASISVGVALASGGSSPDDVLHNADVAMYQSKRQGAGHAVLYDAEAMSGRSAESVDLEAALRRALAENSLSVYYQPLYATEDQEMVGAEALVRWHHPERGLLQPGDFIGLAEDTGLVLGLGEFVLRAACEQARQWQDRSSRDFSVSVNLSARQFQDPGLVHKVSEVLRRTGLAAGHLCLEITESLALEDIDRSINTLRQLKGLGVHLAIDDFGTGYSSLTYLKRFPVDVVKLDRSFVKDLAVSAVDAAIVTAVVDLARTLGLTAVAEGVETAEQLARLAEMGCPVLQGYLLARPMPAEQFAQLLEVPGPLRRVPELEMRTAG